MLLVGAYLMATVTWSCLCLGGAFVTPPVDRAVAFSRWTRRNQPLVASNVVAPSRVRGTPRWQMSAISMEGPGESQEPSTGTGSRVQTIVKPKVDVVPEEEVKDELAKEEWWRVILHNDEIHTFDYVTESITKVVKKLTMKKAYEVTVETHKAGKATVTQAWKSKVLCSLLETSATALWNTRMLGPEIHVSHQAPDMVRWTLITFLGLEKSGVNVLCPIVCQGESKKSLIIVKEDCLRGLWDQYCS